MAMATGSSSLALLRSSSPLVIPRRFATPRISIASAAAAVGFRGSVAAGSHCVKKLSRTDSINSSPELGCVTFDHDHQEQENDLIQMPALLIAQDEDSVATYMELIFDDNLGVLIDTMNAIKGVGLEIMKGSVEINNSIVTTRFYLMQQGHKVKDIIILGDVWRVITDSFSKSHPGSSAKINISDIKSQNAAIPFSSILLEDDGPKRSQLYLECADRPGLLMDITKIITDVNIDIESIEIATDGNIAKDKFYLSYRGSALSSCLSQVLSNCLGFYLTPKQKMKAIEQQVSE